MTNTTIGLPTPSVPLYYLHLHLAVVEVAAVSCSVLLRVVVAERTPANTRHLDSADVCKQACSVLVHIVTGSKENTGLLITLGGGAAVAKVRTKWPHNKDIQTIVRHLNDLIVAEMKAWVDEDKMKHRAEDGHISYNVGVDKSVITQEGQGAAEAVLVDEAVQEEVAGICFCVSIVAIVVATLLAIFR
jgi:hypothetical protein